MSGNSYAGHTYLLRFDNGTVFRNTYSSDGAGLRVETMEGPGTGKTADVSLRTVELAPGLYFVSWLAGDGSSVSHVMNLNDNTVQAFSTWQNDGGSRQGDLRRAFLEPVG